MPLTVDVVAHGIRFAGSKAQVIDAARTTLRSKGVRDAQLSITLVSGQRIAALNRRHLGHRGTTDVISFGFRPAGARSPVVGDIYIAPTVAQRSATARGITVREEIVRLAVHGTLHVLGFDHPEGESRTSSTMWMAQERLVRRVMRRVRR